MAGTFAGPAATPTMSGPRAAGAAREVRRALVPPSMTRPLGIEGPADDLADRAGAHQVEELLARDEARR